MVTPLWVRRLGFWRRVLTGWFCVPVCCGVRFCGAGRGKKSVSSVFSCSPGTVGHSAGAGWLDFSWVWVRPGKSPVRCWTGKSGSGWALGRFRSLLPWCFGWALPGVPGAGAWLKLFGTFCSVGKNPTESNKISNRTKLRTGQMEASKASRMFRAPMTSTPSHLEAERFFRPW